MKPADDTPGAAPAAETGADFSDLQAQAEQLHTAAPPGAPPAATIEDPQAREARELFGALQLARLVVGPMMRWWPEFGTVWSDAQLQNISQAGAAVIVRHGWTVGALFEKWGPYIGLVLATAPPCVATYQAIEYHKAQHLAAQRAAPGRPAPPAAEPQSHAGPE